MDWNDYEMKREQVKDYLREADQDRLARLVGRTRSSIDLKCWLSSRVDFFRALLAYQWGRLRRGASAPNAAPVLADCS